MYFRYFKGPSNDMSNYVEGSHMCSYCKTKSKDCFEVPPVENESASSVNRIGCYSCLRAGRFEFWHDTEFGLLLDDGLKEFYDYHIPPTEMLDSKVLQELRRTPQIVTIQQERWLVHCGDFMTYIGRWDPVDFISHSPTGKGRDLFLDMTAEYQAHLWDDCKLEKANNSSWAVYYYSFRCEECKQLRGYWEMD